MTELSLNVGDYVVFKGYSEKVEIPAFTKGQVVKLVEYIADNDTWAAAPASEEGSTDLEEIFEEEILRKATDEEIAEVTGAASAVADEVAEQKPTKKGKKATKKEAAEGAATKEVTQKPTKTAKTTKTTKKEVEAGSKVDGGTELLAKDSRAVTSASTVETWLSRKDALTAAKELKEQIEDSYFALGGVLSGIYSRKLYEELGYTGNKGFDRYVSTELDIEYRKAMYLINIFDYFTDLGVDYTKLRDLGWSKAKELVGKATPENFDDLVAYAKTHTRGELVEYLRSETVAVGHGDVKTARKVSIKVALFEDQANMVLQAVDSFANSNDLSGDRASYVSEAIAGIVMEWSSLIDGVAVSLEDEIARIETRYGVKLEALPAKDGE